MDNDKKTFEPLQAIGLFWGCFGILILMGIFFSETNMGKAINGICGAIFLLSGVGAFLKGVYNNSKISKD